jgi:hypothetical protein
MSHGNARGLVINIQQQRAGQRTPAKNRHQGETPALQLIFQTHPAP